MNLLKSRRAGGGGTPQGSGNGGGGGTGPETPPWRHMGGEHSAFKAFPQGSSEQENGRRYASSETSEEINVTTDDEDSNLGPEDSRAADDLSRLAQADVRASIESWREMAALSALRGDPVFSPPPPLRGDASVFPPLPSQPLPLTKHDRL